jgi:hypothetical protein
MRIYTVLGLAVVCGIATGIVVGIVNARMFPWKGVYGGPERRETVGVLPKVVVEEDTFNFGVMDGSATGTHDFVFMNQGEGPLLLSEMGTSCKCAVSEIEHDEIPPGGSGKVTVDWKGDGGFGDYRHTATIGTNDPTRERVVLTVQGKLIASVKSVPSELVFSRVTAGEEAEGSVRILGFLSDELKVTGCEFTDPETAEFFQAEYKELPATQVKDEDEDAVCGYLVSVHVKSGLPLGPFRQTIRVKTNLEKAATIDIPVTGSIQSELSIVGAGWSDRNGILTLGTVSSREGAERTLLILVGGQHRKEVEFKPIETFPDLFKVDVGKRDQAEDGSVTKTPLVISIPPGSRPANHLGPGKDHYGRIVLETNHPKVPQVKILVRFAVQG